MKISITDKPVLRVENLRVSFKLDEGLVKAVRGVSFQVERGETLGIVGESGSGKSVTNLAIMGLIPKPPGVIESGRAWFDRRDVLAATQEEMQVVRGRRIGMIFQDPMTALNPLMTIGDQLTEVTRWHLGLTRSEAKQHAAKMLGLVGIPSPESRLKLYPHQFSGGMRQRVMIAMALSCEPDLLIADEPTTALDVTIQAQIIDLLREIQRKKKTSIILITHDLGVVASICHRVLVMYAGKVVEQADVQSIFRSPAHPYTRGLLASLPRIDSEAESRLVSIPGSPPDMTALAAGCSFQPRCPDRIESCESIEPKLVNIGPTCATACLLATPCDPNVVDAVQDSQAEGVQA